MRLSDCISLAPARFDRYLRGFTGHVAHPVRSIGGAKSFGKYELQGKEG
jgi:hypothetical protein